MSVHTVYQIRCDRCGAGMRDDYPGCPMSYPDLPAVETALRDAGWIPDHQGFTTPDGEQDALQVCHACRDAVENGAEP